MKTKFSLVPVGIEFRFNPEDTEYYIKVSDSMNSDEPNVIKIVNDKFIEETILDKNIECYFDEGSNNYV